MLGLLLVSSTLVAFQDAGPPQSRDEQKTTPKAAVDVDPGQVLAEYNALREKARSTAAAQWRLGLWCEEHGLKDQAYVHFAEVVRLDPKRDAAWRKLGLKKYGGRWATEKQIAEDNEQKKADKVWAPRLRKVHKDIHGTNGAKKRDIAQAAIKEISDPRAVLSVYREFGGGGQLDQKILIQVLGEIDKPVSSKVLALLAVYGRTPEVRGRATEILRLRPAHDYLDLLVGMMIDPFKYEVRPVGGPGSPGVLFVEGERFNVSRFYAPPPPPNVTPQPGDTIIYDQSGMPVIARPTGRVGVSMTRDVRGSKILVKETDTEEYAQISPFELMVEAQRGAVMAEAQLERDVALIKGTNADRKRFNDLVMAVAKAATGKDHGKTPKEWREAVAGGNNLSTQASRTPDKPTYGESVPLAYNPAFEPAGYTSLSRTRVFVIERLVDT
ncbi:MAG: hypothetical protein ACHRXM_01955 [Isosphaerales bacterium]